MRRMRPHIENHQLFVKIGNNLRDRLLLYGAVRLLLQDQVRPESLPLEIPRDLTRLLEIRREDFGPNSDTRGELGEVSHDADDFPRPFLRPNTQLYDLSDGRTIREELTRKRFIHHRNPSSGGRIGF